MAGYTFFFLRDDGLAPSFHFTDCPTDDQAMARAAEALKTHPRARTVEVFNGLTTIGQVDRPTDTGAPSRKPVSDRHAS